MVIPLPLVFYFFVNFLEFCSRKKPILFLSLLCFFQGIPGLDESYLPRYIGYGFGALLALNHFLGSDSSSITPSQLVNEFICFLVHIPSYMGTIIVDLGNYFVLWF